MEATGVYWIPLFELLGRRGFDVQRVNSRSTRQVTGCKSDVLDCQRIWQLLSHGLLKGAFHRARLARMEDASAVKATAHQLARLVYAMPTKGQPSIEKGIEAFEARTQERQLKALQKKSQHLGLELIEIV